MLFRSGADALLEASGNAGLNAALAQAATHAAASGAQGVLVLPCDLPRLEAHALEAMAAAPVAATDTVIAPDRHHTGTNALLVDAHVREFAFGEESYARHLALANARGAQAVACVHEALAFDLDTAEDFAAWAASGDAPADLLEMLPRAAPRGMAVTSRTK